MKSFFLRCLWILVLLTTVITSGRAQTLLVNFQAEDYTTGSTTFEDTEGVTATYVGGSSSAGTQNASADGYSLTTNGGFTFATGDVAGLDGLTSFTEAVGFTANSITSETDPFYVQYDFAGNGIMGGDINGGGQGDSGLSISSYGDRIVGGGGVASGGDVNSDVSVYDPMAPSGNFALGQAMGAVLVFQANTAAAGSPANGSVTLYVNGVEEDQQTGLVTQPFGYDKPGMFSSATVGSYQFGIGTLTDAYGPGFDGDITQEQIYSGALDAADAITLSETISEDSIPEPRTWSLLLAAVLFLVGMKARATRA